MPQAYTGMYVSYFSIKLEKNEIEMRNFLMNISKQGHYVKGTGTSVASPRSGPLFSFQAQGFPLLIVSRTVGALACHLIQAEQNHCL